MTPTRVNRADFAHTLGQLRPGLAEVGKVDQCGNFLFRKGKVLTFGGEVCCRAPSPLPKDVECAVPAKPVLGALDVMGGEEVEIRVGDGLFVLLDRIKVKDGKTKYGRRVEFNAEMKVLSPLDVITAPAAWKKVPREFGEAVKMCVEVTAGKDDTRFVLNAVHMTPGWVESTDHYRILRFRVETGLANPTLVNKQHVESLEGLEVTAVAESDRWVHFRNASGVVLSCRAFDGEFPSEKITEVLGFSGEPLVLPKGLVDAAKLAEVVADDPKTAHCEITLSPGVVRIVTNGVSARATEERRVKYRGPERSFQVRPSILEDIARRESDCEVGDDRIKIDGGKWTYFSKLLVKQAKEVERNGREQPVDHPRLPGGEGQARDP